MIDDSLLHASPEEEETKKKNEKTGTRIRKSSSTEFNLTCGERSKSRAGTASSCPPLPCLLPKHPQFTGGYKGTGCDCHTQLAHCVHCMVVHMYVHMYICTYIHTSSATNGGTR